MLIAKREVKLCFNNQMYKELDGVTMGSPLESALANIFVHFQESRLFDNTAKPGIFIRYVRILLSALTPSWIIVFINGNMGT